MKKRTRHGRAIKEQAAKRKWFSVPLFAILALVFAMMLIDSVARIKSGDLAMDYDRRYQPVGPVLRLIVSFVALVTCIVFTWRAFRSKAEHDKLGDDQSPS